MNPMPVNPTPAHPSRPAWQRLATVAALLLPLLAWSQPVEVWRNNSDWRKSDHLWRNYNDSRKPTGLMQDFSFLRPDAAEDADPRSAQWEREKQFRAALADPSKRLAYARQYAAQDKGRGHYMEALCWLEGNCGQKADAKQAMAAARRGAAAGHAKSMVLVGEGLRKGIGVAANPSEALKWFRQAGELGDKDGWYFLGRAAFQGEGMAENLVQARDWFLKADELPAAAGFLGVLYGRFLEPIDPVKSAHYLRRSAEGGDLMGAAFWGELLLDGSDAVKPDLAAARPYLKLAAEAGLSSAMTRWAELLREGTQAEGAQPDPAQARAMLEGAAAQGNPRALFDIGQAHEKGWLGWLADAKAAEPWVLKSANAGYWKAADWLTLHYHQANRPAEARRYNDMGVSLGSYRAYFNRGMAEYDGLWGYAENEKAALEWFIKSSELPYAEGHRMAARILLTGPAELKDGPRGCRHAQAAAELGGNPQTMLWTAQCLEFGLGGHSDRPAAIAWYRKAAEAGYAAAQNHLKRLGLK